MYRMEHHSSVQHASVTTFSVIETQKPTLSVEVMTTTCKHRLYCSDITITMPGLGCCHSILATALGFV